MNQDFGTNHVQSTDSAEPCNSETSKSGKKQKRKLDTAAESTSKQATLNASTNEKTEENVNKTSPKKKKRSGASKNDKKSNKKKSTGKPYRKNIRDILKDDELEAETRAAQQREMERMQRLQQQQRQLLENAGGDPSFLTGFSDSGDDSDEDSEEDNSTTAALVEDLQALAKELEDNSLSPQLPISFMEEREELPATVESPPQLLDEEEEEDVKPIVIKNEPETSKDSDSDVICLSSDEEEVKPSSSSKPVDDDDVVVLSGDEEEPEEAEEDVNNFGLHSQDHLNLPDSEGRVLINVGHPPKEPDVFLAPQLSRIVKPHQVGGIRFLYDNVVESLEQYSVSAGFGCILAHSMGLGKTIQVIAFCDVFIRSTKAKHVLIIVPINTLQNWISEFGMWLPTEQDIQAGWSKSDGPVDPRCFVLHVLNDSTKDLESRFRVISEWRNNGGVLLLGYEMYRLFYTQRQCKQKKRGRKKKAPGLVDVEEEEREKDYLDKIYQALVDPGPDLVICDEGHRIKNMKASISLALKEIRTRRRVVLTGYPLQNNLIEYWCMVDFVRPNFLGTRAEFSNMFERPILNGQCVDSSPADVKLMKERVYVLHSLVQGFVQRRSHTVLRSSLPHKEEHVLLVRMTPFQRALYRHYMSELIQNRSVSNPLKAFAICCKIWNHPDILYNSIKKKDDDVDLDLDEEAIENKKKKAADTSGTAGTATSAVSTATKDENFNWAAELLKGYTPFQIESSAKMEIFFNILEESVRIGDRLLVFSQSLLTLTLLEDFLQQQYIPFRTDERWARNRSYFRLDGSTNATEREKLVNEFNSNPNVMLFLISTRAGSLGINLIGANRVVVFDASWNPCHDAQAVCRVYRYGQMKQCYIYRLVTDNSLEKKIYDRQVGKQGTADRVVDELQPEARLTLKDVTCLICDDEEDPPEADFSHSSAKHEDPVLHTMLKKLGTRITKEPFKHESLFVESKDRKLSKAEKRMAQRLYEKAKQNGFTQYRRQSYANFYPKMPIPTLNGTNLPLKRPLILQRGGAPLIPKPLNSPLQHLGIDMLAEAFAQGKLVCKEMALTRDVTISRTVGNGGDSSGGPIVLTAGTKVKLIRTPKGVYMQTPEGKIFRIHSSTPNATGAAATPAAAALASLKSTASAASGATGSGAGIKAIADPEMLKAMKLAQEKADAESDDAKSQRVISFSDKSGLLAQIRQNLTANKGTVAGARVAVNTADKKIHLTLPKNSSLTEFAKQLAALAKKSAADSSSISSANSGEEGSTRVPSLLDPKARALPSASLPKKIATVTPNLSKARVFTPATTRPTAAVEPITKPVEPPKKVPEPPKQPPEPEKIVQKPVAIPEQPVVPTTSSSTSSSSPGMFDNLSLASQLEGFASCNTNNEASNSLKDLLRTNATSESLPSSLPLDETQQQVPQQPDFSWNLPHDTSGYQNWPAWNQTWNTARQPQQQQHQTWPVQQNQWQQDFTATPSMDPAGTAGQNYVSYPSYANSNPWGMGSSYGTTPYAPSQFTTPNYYANTYGGFNASNYGYPHQATQALNTPAATATPAQTNPVQNSYPGYHTFMNNYASGYSHNYPNGYPQ